MSENEPNGLRAAFLMVCAMAIIGVIDSLIAPLSQHIGLWQFHFIRALIAFPLVVSMSLLGLGSIWPQRWWAVGLRSLLVGISMLFYFSALAWMPIAQALAGLFTSPIFILLINAAFLHSRPGPWRICAVAIGFAGTLFVLQPDIGNFDWAVLIPVAGGFFYALSAIATNRLCAQESTVAVLAGMWVMLCLFGLIGLIALAIFPVDAPAGPDGFVTRGWVWPMTEAVPIVVIQAVFSAIAVFLMIKAYQLGNPSYVSVFEYAVMCFGPLFAWVVFAQTVGPWQILGIAMIIVAGSIIAIRSN